VIVGHNIITLVSDCWSQYNNISKYCWSQYNNISKWVNTKWTIVQLYQMERTSYIQWCPLCTRLTPRVGRHVAPFRHILLKPVFVLTLAYLADNTNVIVFAVLARQGLGPTIYHTRGEHAHHYITGRSIIALDYKYTTS
jgi:hypothetical protein